MVDHVAIMGRNFGDLIGRILSGEKKIESRWSKNKIAPWGRVKSGDTIYFKNSGGPVIVRAEVDRVKWFENLDRNKVREILNKYGGRNGIDVTSHQRTLEWAKNKKYLVLIWLKNSRKVKPFRINKAGFGAGAAWLCVGDVKRIRV